MPQKRNAFLVTSFEGTEVRLMKLWRSSPSLTWQSGIFQVSSVTLFSSVHAQLFGSGSPDPSRIRVCVSVCVCVCVCVRVHACMSEAGEGVKLHSYLHIVFAVLQYKRIYLFSLTLDSAVYLSIDLCIFILYWVVINTVSILLFKWFQVWPLGTLSADSYDFATCSHTFSF